MHFKIFSNHFDVLTHIAKQGEYKLFLNRSWGSVRNYSLVPSYGGWKLCFSYLCVLSDSKEK